MFSFGGQPQQQQQPGGLFGQPQTTSSPFGAAPPLPGSQPGATTGGGLFGAAPTPTSSSLFGASQPAQPSTGGLFGQPSAAPSPFGQPAPTGGMFGQQPAQTGGFFGATSQPTTSPTPSAFGPLAGTSPFGAPAPGGLGGTGGTSVQKYQTTRDQELNMRLVSITAMDCYKNKSFEELRWEDYQANRSQPGGGVGTSPAPTGWGSQPATGTGGLFGASTTPSTTGGMFGQPAAQPASTGLFGASTPSTGGLFGAAQPAAQPATTGGGLFGSTPTTGGGIFGAPTPAAQPTTGGGLFGQAQPQQPATGGGLFGATTTPSTSTGGLFGTPATTTGGGLFGATTQPTPSATTGGGLFGSATPSTMGGGLFGASTATQPTAGGGLFGQAQSAAQPATGGLFGAAQQPATGGGLFGTTTTPSTTAGGGLFGSTTPATTTTGGLFGTSTTTPATTGGLFGTTTTTAPSGGLFGTSTTTPSTTGGGLFGTTTTGAAPTGGLFGTTTTGTTGGGLFGTSTTTPASTGGGLFGTSATTGAPSGGLFGTSATTTTGGGGLFGTTTPAAAPAGTGLGFAQGGLFGAPAAPVAAAAATPLPPVPRPTGLVAPKPVDKDSLSAFLWKDKASETPLVPKKKPSAPSSPPSPRTFVPAALPETTTVSVEEKETTPLRLRKETPLESPKGTVAPSIVVKPKIVYTTPTKGDQSPPRVARSVLPICANHNLWTKPSLEAMEGMTEQELSRVEHFQIGQYGIGSVTWPGLTDVRFLNIDDVIVFKKGSVTLFPDEDLKPPVGTGLNKTAIIELFVRPKNIELAKKFESRYIDEMRKLTESNGAEFLSYDLESWRFRVEHFSTWGIEESMWNMIDENVVPHHRPVAGGPATSKNDLSLFSRIEKDLFIPPAVEEEEESWMHGTDAGSLDEEGPVAPVMSKEDFIGGLAVAPPTREELKSLGWDLKLMDLFLNQSFRVSIGIDGTMAIPEHPVVCDSYNVSVITPTAHGGGEVEEKLVSVFEHKQDWSSTSSTVSLIRALLDGPEEENSEGFNTVAFNEWLSQVNAQRIRSDPALSFSPAAALCSRDYTPSASELLVKSGHPRLALAAAAAHDDASRRLMNDQMSRIEDDDAETQLVADVLGGNISNLKNLDWRSELALRYWYCDGDLNGFEPPSNSIEWRVIRAVVLGDSTEMFKLLDSDLSLSELADLMIAVQLVRLKKPELVVENHMMRIAFALADKILASPRSVDWQLAPLVLAFLPKSLQRDKVIEDIVARNIDKDCSLLLRLGIITEQQRNGIAKSLGLS
jgi:nuclear pore complex protein Nup98-Nup96